MLDNDLEQIIKEALLRGLEEHMDDHMGERMMPKKAMKVEVAAPDKEKLAEGLEKAKQVVGGELPGDDGQSEGEASDEDRLREMLEGAGDSGESEEEDDEDDKDKLGRL